MQTGIATGHAPAPAPPAEAGAAFSGFIAFASRIIAACTLVQCRVVTRPNGAQRYSAATAAEAASNWFRICSAASRPSRIAQTTNEAPRTMSPTA